MCDTTKKHEQWLPPTLTMGEKKSLNWTMQKSAQFKSNGETTGKWRIEGGTLFEVRASHLLKLVCMLVVVTAVVAVTLHWRIRTLEAQRSNLREELHDVKMHLKRLVERVDTIASLAIPPRSQQAHNSKTTMEPHENDDYGDKEQPVNLGGRKKLAKRSAHERSKESQYASSSYSLNALNNDTSASFEVDEWTTNKTPVEMSKSSTDVRAAYLQIDGTSVNIRKSRQLIGPWYLPDSGSSLGFKNSWYNNLALDTNGTSVIFQEDGLFLIYAQVFYQLQHIIDSEPTPMGYRMHLRKNIRHRNRRPITIAECVPSFPSTFYQTCFTQVAWYVEAHDEVYLEHFTESLPMIEALRSGQTFLGIVRLAA